MSRHMMLETSGSVVCGSHLCGVVEVETIIVLYFGAAGLVILTFLEEPSVALMGTPFGANQSSSSSSSSGKIVL